MKQSAIYSGKVTHVRRGSPSHAFAHRLFMLYLDLDELPELSLSPVLGVEAPGLLSFRRKDYRNASRPSLKKSILDEVESELGFRPTGGVRLLTHVRSFGPAFNPVSFYYCFDEDDTLRAVLAEITNTPWKERHAYVLRADENGAIDDFPKAFHVSPFWPMQQRYHWQLSRPGQTLLVEMQNSAAGQEVFRARLGLQRRELSRWSLASAALTTPLMSLQVVFLIYWQALRLWLKRAPIFAHPATPQTAARNET